MAKSPTKPGNYHDTYKRVAGYLCGLRLMVTMMEVKEERTYTAKRVTLSSLDTSA
jgi:hypothetical protein